MAVEHGYCTVEQVRAELSDDNDQLSTDLLEKAVNATSRSVDRWCGRRFWVDATAVARTFRPEASDLAEVGDISTTTGLLVATDLDADGTFETSWTIDTDFLLEPLNADADGGAYAWWEISAVGSKRFPCNSTTRRPLLQVTAKWGWPEVPDQVEEAAILRAVAIFKRKESPYGVADFGEFGPVRITRADPDVMDLLRPFQKVMAA